MEEQTPIPRHQGWRLPVALLSIGWALTFATFTACAAAINLAGASFSSPGYHTFPLAVVAFSSGLHNLLLPREIAVLGRWRAYLLGALLGGSGCLLCFAACEAASMALLCCGAVLIGVGIAHGQNYRFGVLLCVPDAANHPVAISWVLAGGVIGAVVGPEYAKHSRDLPPLRPYSGVFIVSAVAYAMLFALLLLGVGPLQGRRGGSAAAADPHRRRLVAVFAQPRCAACTFVATASFSVMTFLMAAVPLAMSSSGFTFDDSSTVIQGHSAPLTPPGPWPAFCSHPCRRMLPAVLAMFVPSFVTGHLVKRFGAPALQLLGAALLAAGGAFMLGYLDRLVGFAASQMYAHLGLEPWTSRKTESK